MSKKKKQVDNSENGRKLKRLDDLIEEYIKRFYLYNWKLIKVGADDFRIFSDGTPEGKAEGVEFNEETDNNFFTFDYFLIRTYISKEEFPIIEYINDNELCEHINSKHEKDIFQYIADAIRQNVRDDIAIRRYKRSKNADIYYLGEYVMKAQLIQQSEVYHLEITTDEVVLHDPTFYA